MNTRNLANILVKEMIDDCMFKYNLLWQDLRFIAAKEIILAFALFFCPDSKIGVVVSKQVLFELNQLTQVVRNITLFFPGPFTWLG